MDLYKIVGPNGECLNGGSGDWPLPIDGKPGEWRTVDGPLEACRNGLHLATDAQVPHWYNAYQGGIVYRVETDGPLLDNGDKWVAGKVRLLPRRDSRAADMVKAAALLERRKRAALRKLNEVKATAVVPDAWRSYLSAIQGLKLPAAHPGAHYQADYEADAARLGAAQGVYHAAVTVAQNAYDAAALAGIMPE